MIELYEIAMIYVILNQAFNTLYISTSTYIKFYVSFFSDHVSRRRTVFNFLYEAFTKTCKLFYVY